MQEYELLPSRLDRRPKRPGQPAAYRQHQDEDENEEFAHAGLNSLDDSLQAVRDQTGLIPNH